MFTLLLRNYHDQGLVRRVWEATRLDDINVPTAARETFVPPLLADGKHLDRAEIDACARNALHFLGISVGLNDEYHCIQDGIYASMVKYLRRSKLKIWKQGVAVKEDPIMYHSFVSNYCSNLILCNSLLKMNTIFLPLMTTSPCLGSAYFTAFFIYLAYITWFHFA